MTSFTPEQAAQWLLSLEMFGMRFGLERMRRLLETNLDPRAYHIEATELSLQEEQAEQNIWALLAFPLGVLFVYMVLAA